MLISSGFGILVNIMWVHLFAVNAAAAAIKKQLQIPKSHVELKLKDACEMLA